MSTIVRLAYRNTFRRRNRSLLTAGMVVAGVAMLLLAMTWIRGLFAQMVATGAAVSGHVRVVHPEYAEREELTPLDKNVADVDAMRARLSRQPGVVAVEPKISAGVTVTVGEEIGDVFGLAVGATQRYFEERMDLRGKIHQGGWFTGATDEVVAGAKIVEETGAKVGDELVMLGVTQDGSLSPIKAKLVGVVASGGILDQQMFLPLKKLQYLTDIPGGATEILVYGKTHEESEALARRLSGLPELKSWTVQAFSRREPWEAMIGQVGVMQGIIGGIVVFLTALGIWNTMMMSVLERTHEIGVLRAMGLSRLGAVGLFVGEALAIGIAGGAVGVLVALYPAWLLETKGMNIGAETASRMTVPISETMHGDLNLANVLLAFGLGLLTVLIGSLLPALRAASIQPVTAMRTGR